MKRKAKDVLFVNQLRGNEIVSKDRKKIKAKYILCYL